MVVTWLHASMLISCPFPNIWNFHTCRIQAQTTQVDLYHLEGGWANLYWWISDARPMQLLQQYISSL
jgi:hypothetical protein